MTITRRQTPALTALRRLSSPRRRVTIRDNIGPMDDNPRQPGRLNRATIAPSLNTIASVFGKYATGKRKFGVLANMRDNPGASRFRLGVGLRLTRKLARVKGRNRRLTPLAILLF